MAQYMNRCLHSSSFIAALLFICTSVITPNASAVTRDLPAISLAGTWQFRLDPDNQGQSHQWAQKPWHDSSTIQLPGSLQDQGFGNDVTLDTPWTGTVRGKIYYHDKQYAPYRKPGNIKIPFWLQPKKHYIGVAWCRRTIHIPVDWQHQDIILYLQRTHWSTTLWIDGNRVGERHTLSTPNRYNITKALSESDHPAGEHTVTLLVDNRLYVNVGSDASSVTDNTQTNWNGIIGELKLEAIPAVSIQNISVFPNVADRSASINITFANPHGTKGSATIVLDTRSYNTPKSDDPASVTQKITLDASTSQSVTIKYPMGSNMLPWDEFHPALYQLTATLQTADPHPFVATAIVSFGMRDIATKNNQFTINGHPFFVRGTLECCTFPRTGYPPTSLAPWMHIMRVCKQHGLNSIRFHSYCPPNAAFVAADRLGLYLQVEAPVWAKLGDSKPIDRWLGTEANRILQTFGNHPSLVFFSGGNEPAGKHYRSFLDNLVANWKTQDNRHLYIGGTGWPDLSHNDYFNTPTPRIRAWGHGMRNRLEATRPATTADYRKFASRYHVPVMAHEIGEWCVYPNFSEMDKYTGLLQPNNFEIAEDLLQENHMGDQARQFLMASGKLQVLCYKEEIESQLRTPHYGGFQLLGLHDFPGQGTALVGILDPFWDPKPYINAKQFTQFCGPIVPLARLTQRTFKNNQTLNAQIQISDFGPANQPNTTIQWQLIRADTQRALATGQFINQDLTAGKLNTIGDLSIDLAKVSISKPAKLTLVVSIKDSNIKNHWNIWVYPAQTDIAPPTNLVITHALDQKAIAALKQGKRVLLLIPPAEVNTHGQQIGFAPVFWNTLWTDDQAPQTLGILCDPRNPVFQSFPTSYHTDWQWWAPIHQSAAMVLDKLPPQLNSIVQPIDTWVYAHRLSLMFEAKVDAGKLFVCSIDLTDHADQYPALAQLRQSLFQYLASPAFQPAVTLTPGQIQSLFIKAQK